MATRNVATMRAALDLPGEEHRLVPHWPRLDLYPEVRSPSGHPEHHGERLPRAGRQGLGDGEDTLRRVEHPLHGLVTSRRLNGHLAEVKGFGGAVGNGHFERDGAGGTRGPGRGRAG